jgi:AAA ATPase domain
MRLNEPLIERDAELAALATGVSLAASGTGGVIRLEAPAGLGKTSLLKRAMADAEAAGCAVRCATPGPLERHFPYGVIRALLETPLRKSSEEDRRQLVHGVAARASSMLLDGEIPPVDASMVLAHSLMWLAAGFAARAPLVLVVDDAQWADRPSLEALSYLAGRIAGAPR